MECSELKKKSTETGSRLVAVRGREKEEWGMISNEYKGFLRVMEKSKISCDGYVTL